MNDETKRKRDEEKMALARLREEALAINQLQQQQQQQDLLDQAEVEDDTRADVVINAAEDFWKKILAAYKLRYPEQELEEEHCLVFPSRKAAEAFFTEHAKNHLEFLSTWKIGGVVMDDHLFSCGDGKLYKGSFAAIHQQLEQALKAEADPDLQNKITTGINKIKGFLPQERNPTLEMRGKLQASKQEAEEEQSDENTNTPSPFKKKPFSPF